MTEDSSDFVTVISVGALAVGGIGLLTSIFTTEPIADATYLALVIGILAALFVCIPKPKPDCTDD